MSVLTFSEKEAKRSFNKFWNGYISNKNLDSVDYYYKNKKNDFINLLFITQNLFEKLEQYKELEEENLDLKKEINNLNYNLNDLKNKIYSLEEYVDKLEDELY